MKMRIILATIAFITLFVNSVSGQQGSSSRSDSARKEGTGKMVIPEVVAKPVFEGTNGGLHLRVWIMSVIKTNNDDLNNKVSAEVKNGTHHIMVEVAGAEDKNEIPGAIVKVMIVSPTQKESTVDLKAMMNQYGANLELDEKGEYQFNVSVNVNGELIQSPFKYTNN
jgi:hypothetical protein